jgi:spore germination protein GerM
LVYLVKDDALTAVEAGTAADGPDTAAAVSAVLERLAAGPTNQERASGLSTALGPDVRITLGGLQGRRASIDIDAGTQLPSAGRVPLAVGQIVLSVTSIPEVDTVVLTRDGRPIEAPLPGGALAPGPVAAADYAELLQPLVPSPSPT